MHNVTEIYTKSVNHFTIDVNSFSDPKDYSFEVSNVLGMFEEYRENNTHSLIHITIVDDGESYESIYLPASEIVYVYTRIVRENRDE